MKKINLTKGQIIQRKGDLNSKVYHVESGLLRSYTIDHKGKDHIFMFAPGGWIIADNVSPEQPCDLYIDAIEDSIVIQKVKDSDSDHEIRKLIKRLEVLQKRVIMLMSASATERYEHFIQTYPDIVQRVPQKMIASYLGITPQALSTLRGEIAGK
ncbi:MAG: Crp/Fnr family transcriptional regulator [Bacteroidota bacterium]